MIKLNPKVDFVFKKLFGVEENKDLLINLINSIVSEKDQVKDIIIKNPYTIKNFKTDKNPILDIKAQDAKTDTWFNIEIQVSKQDAYDFRALYYWGKVFTEQINSGENYDLLKKTISINFLNFTLIPELDYHNIYKIFNVQSKKEYMHDLLELHFIELKKFDSHKKAKTLLDKWTYFLKDADKFDDIPEELEEIPEIKKAIDVLENVNMSPEEREAYEAAMKTIRDKNAVIETARREGIAKGLIEGRAEGRAEGLAEGLAEGREKEKIEVVLKLKKMGVDIEMIAHGVSLSVDQVKEILEKEKLPL